MTTRTEIKADAQDRLMLAIQGAFAHAYDDRHSEAAGEEVIAEMSRQFARIERLFGYEAFTWQRGC